MGLSYFRCKLITRSRCMLDCMAHSVIVPAVDGQLGIMRGHSPVVCELGFGIMSAKKLRSIEGENLPNEYFLIDGGFAQIVENFAIILAYDVTMFEGIGMGEVDKMLRQAEMLLAADAYAKQTRAKDVKKAELIKRLAQMMKTQGGRGYDE